MIERATVAKDERLVPMGLTQDARVVQEIPEDGMITFDNVQLADSFAYRLIQQQE